MAGRLTPRQLFTCLLVYATMLAGCSSTPDYPPRSTTGKHPGVAIAYDMLGAPYRYGGASPRGFDCSGLVYYSYRKAGIHVPRTTQAQFRGAQRVKKSELQEGDLVFFKLTRANVSHVGIYTGRGNFIHAPSSGKHVRYGSLKDSYWRDHLVAAGRYQGNSQ